MDGPNVNQLLYYIITEERKENGHPELINVGLCSFHGVHGAFHTGEKKTNWGIENVLKSLYNLFDETTARREEYRDITKSDVFPITLLWT